jgi:Mg-chelatase subunit ChlD
MSKSKNRTEKAGTTLLTLVVDRSGSMAPIKDDMEGGIKTLIEEQAGEQGACLVTLAQFDNEYEVVADGVPAAEMTPYRLVPRGMTALLDAIGRTVATVHARIEAMDPEDRPANVLFAVITDGMENASCEWSRLQVMDSVKARTAEGWHFTFLGADQDAVREGRGLGVDDKASLTWDKSAQGTAGAMRSVSASYRRVRRGEAQSLAYTEDERRAASAD